MGEVVNKGVQVYYPEMGEKKPIAQMEASLSHYGRHYYVRTPLELKGRGITLLQVIGPKTYHNGKYAGWNEYKVTWRAFEALKEKHSISMERLLD